jgi:hypothetical protein
MIAIVVIIIIMLLIRKEVCMDVKIGKYKIRFDGNYVILTHSTGIAFDLTPDEALGFADFIGVYRQTLISNRGEEGSKDAYNEDYG